MAKPFKWTYQGKPLYARLADLRPERLPRGHLLVENVSSDVRTRAVDCFALFQPARCRPQSCDVESQGAHDARGRPVWRTNRIRWWLFFPPNCARTSAIGLPRLLPVGVAPRAAARRRPGAVRTPGRSSSARDDQRHDSAPKRLRLPRLALWRAADAREILLVTWIRKPVCWAQRGGQPGRSEGGGGMAHPKPAAPGPAVNLVANCTEDAVHG